MAMSKLDNGSDDQKKAALDAMSIRERAGIEPNPEIIDKPRWEK